MKFEYLRIRKLNPHIPAWRVFEYLKQFNGRFPWTVSAGVLFPDGKFYSLLA